MPVMGALEGNIGYLGRQAVDEVSPAVKSTIKSLGNEKGFIDLSTGKPFAKPGPQDYLDLNETPINKTTPAIPDKGSLIKNEKGDWVPSPKPETPIMAQGGEAPGRGFTPQEQAQASAEFNQPKAQPDTGTAPTSEVPFPKVSTEPVDVSSARTGKNPLTGGNPVLVDLRGEAGKNQYYLDDQNQARNALDKYVPGNTALEVEKNLGPKIQEDSQRIKNIIASNPDASMTVGDLIKANQDALRVAGRNPAAPDGINTETASLFQELNLQRGVSGQVDTSQVLKGNDLIDMKKYLDDRLKNVYKKLDNNGTLTPAETATLTLRRTINNNLKSMYPDNPDMPGTGIGSALDRQQGMINARQSVADAASKEEAGLSATATEKANASSKIPPFLRPVTNALGKQPAWLKTAETLGVGALGLNELKDLPNQVGTAVGIAQTGLGDVKNLFSKENQAVADQKGIDMGAHDPSISRYTKDVNIDNSGHLILSQPTTPVKTLTPGTPDYVLASNSLSDGKRTFMSNATTLIAPAINQLSDDLKTMPLDIWHGLDSSQKVDNYTSNPKNPYAKQVSDLNNFNSMYKSAYKAITGSDAEATQLLTPGLAPDQFKQRYAAMIQMVNDTYNHFYTPWAQTSEIPGNQGNNGGIAPYTQTTGPQSWNDPGMTNNAGLPPIGSILNQ
jgi:hypothetical protein